MDFQLHHGDCLDLMQALPDASVDMILCDLPYGTTRNKWDVVIPFDPLWREYKRLCRGAIVLTAAQPFTSKLVVSNICAFRQSLVWRKNVASNFLNANRQHLSRHEDVLLFAFGKHKFNKQMRAGKPYVAERYGHDDAGENYGRISRTTTVNTGGRNPISVLDFDREVGLHRTQKPVGLMEYLVRTYSDAGDVVLDNCMGSGTTGVACANAGRRFVGMEMDAAYFDIARERIAAAYTPDCSTWNTSANDNGEAAVAA